MAVHFILTAREHHGVDSVARLRARHATAIAAKTRAGMRYRVHQDARPVDAFVNAGSWVVLCPSCNSGCATDPAWGVACCFGCGAVYESVVFPPAAAAIETELLDRPQVITRNWRPGETVATLRAETVAHKGARR